MLKNYFYLNRCVIELNEVLCGSRVGEIFTQEKNKLYIECTTEDFPHRHLIISADPNLPYLILRNHHKAKKNLLYVFEDVQNSKIINLEIADDDRIVKINLDDSSIFFFVRGAGTNIALKNKNGDYTFFKKENNIEKLQDELDNKIFVTEKNIELPGTDFDNKSRWKDIKSVFPKIDKYIWNETVFRNDSSHSESLKMSITHVINEIYSSDIRVEYNKNINEFIFAPASYNLFSLSEESFLFSSVSEAVNKYISLRYFYSRYKNLKDEIEKYLQKELETLSNRINKLRNRLDVGSNDDLYKHYGNLLLSNIYKIKKGQKKIEVTDYLSNEPVEIQLDEKSSPQENIDRYFKKSRDERINYEQSKILYKNSINAYELLIIAKEKLENVKTIDDLESIKSDLRIKPKKKMEYQSETIKYRKYLVDNKYDVYVGKDSKSNDLLTTKMTKQNDFWFHARGLPGSHVVLRVDNPKAGVPKNILKNAASIAAFYSKGKTAKLVPVAYTFGKYVTKRKGMEPGKVNVSRETVLLVKPEIPTNCVLVEE
ncbi:MAG: NFACT RNA binding domain-containing protein [Melioribacteraceae bacterium]|nr:NFACT RNA binding domain-containing protein [Melioribacteraceae bacterium]MCF8352881.1 NFACT RNA binding domain-containing protein [Melioribacteraceae bacterium]MCF8417398.1 NFACT RNA binding domain-containing protein [Melioribacteraceae bacterium]